MKPCIFSEGCQFGSSGKMYSQAEVAEGGRIGIELEQERLPVHVDRDK